MLPRVSLGRPHLLVLRLVLFLPAVLHKARERDLEKGPGDKNEECASTSR